MEANNLKRGKSLTLQIFFAFLTNFSNISPGMSIGFSAVANPALMTTFDSQQISWFASIASLATPIGCIITGPIADRFGRKSALAIVNVTSFIGWLIIGSAYYYAEAQYSVLLIGRFVTGLATGLCGTPAAVYMAEIASPELRGVFTTWVSLFYAVGIFCVYLLGLIFKNNWSYIALIAAGFPLFGLIFLKFFIPESPPWLIAKNRIQEAKENMCKLYDTKIYNENVQNEVETLLKNRRQKKTQNKTLLQQFLKKIKLLLKASFLRPFALILTYFFFQQFTGVFVIMFYAIEIVKQSQIELDPYITIVIIASVRLVAMLLVSYLSKNYGRRPLSIISGIGIAVSMLALGGYISSVKNGLINGEYEKKLSPIPLSLLIFYFFISTIGFYPMPFALSSEVYPRNIRGTAAGLGTAVNFIFNFIAVKLYNTMTLSMGMTGIYFFYGTIAVLGTIFVIFCLPETRGKTLEEIQEYFVKKKKDVDNELEELN